MDEAVMDFREPLKGLNPSLMIESVYLTNRYLFENLTKDAFLLQLQADVKTPNRDQAVGVVFDIVDAIEEATGRPTNALSSAERQAFLAQINTLTRESKAPVDPAKVEAALAELRAMR
jgi:hypothetical protein